MTRLTAEDALTPHIMAVGEEMRPRDVAVASETIVAGGRVGLAYLISWGQSTQA